MQIDPRATRPTKANALRWLLAFCEMNDPDTQEAKDLDRLYFVLRRRLNAIATELRCVVRDTDPDRKIIEVDRANLIGIAKKLESM